MSAEDRKRRLLRSNRGGGKSWLLFYGDRLLEDGAFRLLEDGGLRVLEAGSFATGSMLLEDGFFVLLEDGSQVLFG
jgi:hypothetical protein